MPESQDAAAAAAAAASRVDLGEITPHNVRLLRKINASVFPVVYHDKFYKDVLDAGDLAKLAYYNDVVVGAVCCRVDAPVVGPNGQQQQGKRLYIMTLGCLAPYRRLGVGTMMLDHVMDIAAKEGNIESIFLHVQGNNEGALAFYRRHGFEVVDTKEEYYKRIQPANAHVLEKRLDGSRTSSSKKPATVMAEGINGDARED